MLVNVDELIEKSKEQRGRKRYEEALISSLAAVEQDDKNGEAWWQVALSRQILGDTKNTILALRKTVDLIPDASNAWARLGDLLLKERESDEARDAFETALVYDDEQITALEGMSSIYANENNQDQDEDEISVLERIEHLSSLSKFQINRFGILHYRNSRIHEAIRCWKMDIWNAEHPSQRYNLGLAYNKDSLSQDADAIDMWRLALKDWPDYEPSQKCIFNVLPRLLDLAARARSEGDTILPEEQWFDHYMNPFELLNPTEDTNIADLDAKTIQRLKKMLLTEIDLEDGKVTWMPGVVIDKSRAIGLCDELNDEKKKEWHWLVFSNKPLLGFLTKGTHEHFLVRPDMSELDTVERIERDDDFLEWLSNFFAPQFDRVLTKAIDQGNVILVECLLDGRRWVSASMVDDCFRNAQRAIERLVKPLEDLWQDADEIKPSVRAVEYAFKQGRLLEIMNLLPVFFEKYQNEAVHSVRELALKAFNIHDDIDLSRQIIEQAKCFKFRSMNSNRAIEDDVKAIEELIQKERKYEAKLTKGDQNWKITKEGIQQGDIFIAAGDISAVRWGALITSESTGKVSDFLLAFRAEDGRRLAFQWKANEYELEKHRGFFDNLIDATLNYVFPLLAAKTEKMLSEGKSINVGPCRVTSHGIHYDVKGWIFTDQYFTPWSRVQILMNNGIMFVIDAVKPQKRVSFSLRDTDNAPLLKILANMKNGKDN